MSKTELNLEEEKKKDKTSSYVRNILSSDDWFFRATQKQKANAPKTVLVKVSDDHFRFALALTIGTASVYVRR